MSSSPFDRLIVERKARKNRFLHLIISDPGHPKERYIAYFCNETGLSWRTVKQYLKELLEDHLVEEREGKLYPGLWVSVKTFEAS
jgi:predicted transcriptional regulator